jgi:hypothetical protein
MTQNKIGADNLAKRKGAGRPKGSKNKTTATAKSIIEAAAQGLGGAERLLAWAQEAPENERAFWTNIFPKLMPLQVNGPGDEGEHIHKIVSEVVYPKDKK